jgi:transposase-like protein
MKAKKEKQKEAKRLREDGKSVKNIAKLLGVAQSSVSTWVRDVQLTKEQQDALERNRIRNLSYVPCNSNHYREIRIKNQNIGRQKYARCDKDFAVGCSLFWSEGSNKRNSVSFCNTDPAMMRIFVDFICGNFDVNRSEILLTVNCYLNNGISLTDIQKYWLNILGLEYVNIRKATIKSKYYDGAKSSKYPYGVCRIDIHRTDVVQQLYGAIKEMTKDDSEKWLD